MTSPGDLAARILSGESPPAVKRAAARGALPLEPAELLDLQVRLRRDPDPEVGAAARESLEQAPPRLLASLAGEPTASPELVGYLLTERPDLPGRLRADLVAHPSAAAEDLEAVARSETEAEVLDALLANQTLLLARPGIVQGLEANGALTGDHRRRLADMTEHLLRQAAAPDGAPTRATEQPPPEARPPGTLPEGLEPAKDPKLAALGIDAEVEAMLPVLDIDVGDLLSASEIQGAEELTEDADHRSAYERILHLTVGQKLRLALFGTREERSILVRDTNKLIAVSSVKNPRVTEDELELISTSRNVCEEVILEISRRKDAMKRYAVTCNLVRNPKTPMALAARLVAHLRDRELKLLAGDRNVSELVRTTARKQMMARAERQKISYGRKH